jgi:hypothetical protein
MIKNQNKAVAAIIQKNLEKNKYFLLSISHNSLATNYAFHKTVYEI